MNMSIDLFDPNSDDGCKLYDNLFDFVSELIGARKVRRIVSSVPFVEGVYIVNEPEFELSSDIIFGTDSGKFDDVAYIGVTYKGNYAHVLDTALQEEVFQIFTKDDCIGHYCTDGKVFKSAEEANAYIEANFTVENVVNEKQIQINIDEVFNSKAELIIGLETITEALKNDHGCGLVPAWDVHLLGGEEEEEEDNDVTVLNLFQRNDFVNIFHSKDINDCNICNSFNSCITTKNNDEDSFFNAEDFIFDEMNISQLLNSETALYVIVAEMVVLKYTNETNPEMFKSLDRDISQAKSLYEQCKVEIRRRGLVIPVREPVNETNYHKFISLLSDFEESDVDTFGF
jgi:hypothetical protein